MTAAAAHARRTPQLAGALGTVALADVLQLLELGRKTGVLAVDGGDGGRGLVRLAGGAIAAARFEGRGPAGAATADVTRAVGALLAVSAGRFAFTPTPDAPTAGPRLRVEAVLMAAVHAADEQARPAPPAASATSPSPSAAPSPAPAVPVLVASRPAASPLRLRPRHWAALAAVDGRRDAAAVAGAAGLAAADAERTLAELCAAGLVAYAGAGAPPVPPAPARSSGS